MAREYGKVKTSIWHDEEFAPALDFAEQWLYMHLLAQANLSLAGVLDLNVARWAHRVRGATVGDIEIAIAALEAGNFIIVDRSTGELMIRTFIAHDFHLGRLSKPFIKGFWSAWGAVESKALRHQILLGIPDPIWDRLATLAPDHALEIRRSAPFQWDALLPLEPEDALPLERQAPSPLEPTQTHTHTHTHTHPHPPPARARALAYAGAPAGVRETEPAGAGDEDGLLSPKLSLSRQERAEAACDELGDINHDAALGEGTVRFPDGHRSACRRSARTDHLQAAQMLAHEHPDWTPSEIATSIATPVASWTPLPPLEPPARSLYETQEELRRQWDAKGPSRDPAVLSAGVSAARAALEAARAKAAAEADTTEPEEPTP